MSVNSAAVTASATSLPRSLRRLLVVLVALAAMAGLLGLAGLLLGAGAPATPPPKNPFGTGLREAAPAATGFGGWILSVQSEFYRGLTGALSAMKREEAAIWSLAGIGFLYGAFHAAGPGHGKGVISGYILATKRTLARGVGLSFAAAFLQAAVAIGLVGVLAVSGLIEGFLTGSSLPWPVKIAVGALALAAFWTYTVVLGRRAVAAGHTGDLDTDRAGHVLPVAG